MVIDPPMTDGELEEFCRLNEFGQIERTREGVILMNPPVGMFTSDGNSEIDRQLRNWWITHRRGRVGDSSAGFYLPDGSLLSPDAAYLLPETLAKTSKADLKGFPHISPDFVIELRSYSDRLPVVMAKMERWIENGVQLGWLIDPDTHAVYVYRPGKPVKRLEAPVMVTGEGPVAGFELDLREVWDCYDEE